MLSINDNTEDPEITFLRLHQQMSEVCHSDEIAWMECPCGKLLAYFCPVCHEQLGCFRFKGPEPCEHVESVIDGSLEWSQ